MTDLTTIDPLAATVTHITQALNEPNTTLLQKVVAHLGSERVLAFLQQTQQIEAGVGLLAENRKRRRTPGGVFFYLVKHSLPPNQLSSSRRRSMRCWRHSNNGARSRRVSGATPTTK